MTDLSGFKTQGQRQLDSKLKQALELHQKNQLPQARAAYEQVLGMDGNHPEAHYFLGLLLRDSGDLAQALGHFERAAALQPKRVEYRMECAGAYAALGKNDQALALYTEITQQNPQHAIALFFLGQAQERAGNPAEAARAYRLAIAAQPDFPEALNNLGNVSRQSGHLDEAEKAYRQAVEARPEFAEAYRNLGVLYHFDRRDPARAIDYYCKATELKPEFFEAHFNLAMAYDAVGSREKAVATYEQVLALRPDHAESYNNLGMIFFAEHFYDEARACYEQALHFQPTLAEAHNNLGIWWSQLERFDEAMQHYSKAIEINPGFADPYNGLGLMLSAKGRHDEAIASFLSALNIRPGFAEAAANLGRAYQTLGRLEDAREAYEIAMQDGRNRSLKIKIATMLSPIMGTMTEVLESRAEIERQLDALLGSDLRFGEDEVLKYADTNFSLAYHGMNDKDIQVKIARLFSQACPSLNYVSPYIGQPKNAQKTRIGFLSRFFYNHSVGNFFNPIIEYIAAQPQFEVVLISVGHKDDEVLQKVASACHEHVTLTANSLENARRELAERRLDMLVYADIGMDPFSYYLAFSRLAPIQCVLQGHSVTSGVPTLDYFISSRLIEPDDAQEQYSEKLALLDILPMYLREFPPLANLLSRAQLGLPEDRHLYVCPMKLQKVHAEMDHAIREILQQDERGVAVFFNDNVNPHWGDMLRSRFMRTIPEVMDRVLFLPYAESLDRFRSIMAHADVVLDTFGHGGGTTCNLCFSVSAPIVGLLGKTCRGYAPYAFYKLMGIEGCIANDTRQFVNIAIEIAQNRAQHDSLASHIRSNLRKVYRHNEHVLDSYLSLIKQLSGT